ncbi:MAG: alcohol dehydrogenase catalytic domain-containing protein [Chloroflexi bacterium]|nr:alcohol dehydrogenase catalytic domain-containing protein [Chloroflexota bacterium]
MRAVVFDGVLAVRDVPRPVPGDGEALVRVRLAGICNTDIEITRGYADFCGILGHEFVGTAETGSLAGRRVVGEINFACGHCAMCMQGRRSHCLSRRVLGIRHADGAMAEWLSIPAENLHAVPDEVTDRQAVFTEPLAAALEVLEGAHVRPSERVLVLGDGKLGQLAARVVALTGGDVTLVGRHTTKLALAASCGIGTCTEADADRLTGADLVVDCTGSAAGFQLAARLVRAQGRIVLKSTFHGEQSVALTPIAVNEVTVIGSRCGPFAAALRLLSRRLVDVESLISDTMPLSAGIAAFDRAQSSGVLKILLAVDA